MFRHLVNLIKMYIRQLIDLNIIFWVNILHNTLIKNENKLHTKLSSYCCTINELYE